jgi:hypothetical protein
MKNFDYKKIIPDAAAVVIFILITFLFFQPLFDGKQLKQTDITNHKGMSKEITDYRDSHDGEEPLWTNSMFGGMPAYQISVYYGVNFLSYVDRYIFRLGLPRPADYLFIYLLGFFIFLRALKVDAWLAIIGAVAFAFSSYFIIILEAGHNSKAHAIGYMAPALAFIILTFRGKYLLGGALTALFLGLQIYTNHLQITYYLALIVIILGLVEFFTALKEKRLPQFLKASGVLLIAALLAFSTNIGRLLTTMEYSPYTIRGKAELTFDQHDKSTSGLDKSYATQWSYGKGESWSLLIPNAKGGATGYLAEHEKALDKIEPQLRQTVARQNAYWGDQPFTSGPVYVGALIVFLFVLGLFVLKTELRWVFLIATLLSISLAWGKNMMWLTDLFLDYFPAYNKFRAVSMILVIAQLSMAILAMLALNKIVKEPEILKEKKQYFFISFGLTAGLSLLFYLMPDLFFSFLSQAEVAQLNNLLSSDPGNAINYQAVFDGMEEARKSIFKADAIRSFLFITVGAAVLFVYGNKKLPKIALIIVVGLLVLIDMVSVDRRYLHEDKFVSKRTASVPFQPTQADQYILQDTDPNYRVLNLTVGPWQDASTSYFHKSLGGYHGAKFRRYQDLIDYHLSKFNMQVINMLNTKYFIQQGQDGQPVASPNYSALGNAWFVQDIKWAKNPNEEISMLGKVLQIENLNPKAMLRLYGRELKQVDTMMMTVPLELMMPGSDKPVEEIDLSRLPLEEGKEYILGYNLTDTTPNFINLSGVKNSTMIAAQQFRVRVISSFDASKQVVINEKWNDQLSSLSKPLDASGSIKLTSYEPNHLIYQSQSSQAGLAVFSEIYYPEGWQAYIDNKEIPHIQANYVLRALIIPAGEHKIEFKFEPSTYYMGNKITFVSSLIVILLVGFVAYRAFMALKEDEQTTA